MSNDVKPYSDDEIEALRRAFPKKYASDGDERRRCLATIDALKAALDAPDDAGEAGEPSLYSMDRARKIVRNHIVPPGFSFDANANLLADRIARAIDAAHPTPLAARLARAEKALERAWWNIENPDVDGVCLSRDDEALIRAALADAGRE